MTREDMEFIENLFRSLEKELHETEARLEAMIDQRFDQVNARLDHTNARMERIGGLVNGGSRAVAKMIEWTERTDVTLADVLRRQTEFDQRLRKLEAGKGENS